MTSLQISEQIAAIRNATAKASVSKEAAMEFLVAAGIIEANEQVIDDANDLQNTDLRSF